MYCPKCDLINHPKAQRCDCGYDFVSDSMKESYLSDDSGDEAEPTGALAFEQKLANKGQLAGIGMMVLAAVWFVGGLAADRVFFYPPVLFFVGLIAFVRGQSQRPPRH